MKLICNNCRFFVHNQCVRYPEPVAKKPTDFCGEFSPLPNEDIRETGKELITDNEYGVSDSWDNQYNGETIY